MSLGVMLMVLLGAVLHATWNIIVKAGSDKQLDIILLTCGAAGVVVLALPFFPLPGKASWPYLGASVAIHVAYFTLVGLAYRTGDLSYAYPLMRGSAPLLTAVVAAIAIREPLSFGGWLGIGLISAGILTLTGDSWHKGRFPLASTVYGLLNAFVIVAYTVVDGLGVRLSGNPSSYILWLFLLIPMPLLFWTLLNRPGAFQAQFRLHWRASILGGMCTAGSYGLALWAMTLAPIALVAGLRETSVIFGTVFACLFLKEQFGVLRYAAAGAVTAGGMAIKLF